MTRGGAGRGMRRRSSCADYPWVPKSAPVGPFTSRAAVAGAAAVCYVRAFQPPSKAWTNYEPRAARPDAVLDAVHGAAPVQGAAAPARARRGHVLLGRAGAETARRVRRAVVHQCRARAASRSSRRSRDKQANSITRPPFSSAIPRRSNSPRAWRRSRPRHGPRVLHQLGFRGGGNRAQDRARLFSRDRAGPPLPPDRPREGLSRRQFRRHLGGRHGQQPQGLRRSCSGYGRSPAAAL